jgi:hypothetical protein
MAVIVALLAFSASGVVSLVANEPCTTYERPGQNDDGACPPTCVTCGCCAQAVNTVVVAVAVSRNIPLAEVPSFVSRFPQTAPRDILHVPKSSLT